MAHPLRTAESWLDEGEDEIYEDEFIFRYTLDADGKVQVLQLPPTRENLLDPREGDEVSHSNPHARVLGPLVVAARLELESRTASGGPGYGVFQELLLQIKHHPGCTHDVTPDVLVVSGIEDPDQVEESMDVIAEGYGIPLVIEVVSTKYKSSREKDEIDNVPVYDRLGVDDYVMVYPRVGSRGETLRLKAKTRGLRRSFIDNLPNPQGRIRIHSLDWWIYVDEEGRLALEDAKTGRRIWFHIDEHRLRLAAEQRAEEAERQVEEMAEARREAERKAQEEAEARREAVETARHEAVETARRQSAETLVLLLEGRGHTLSDEDRQHIFSRDADTLRRWTLAAFDIRTPSELWKL